MTIVRTDVQTVDASQFPDAAKARAAVEAALGLAGEVVKKAAQDNINQLMNVQNTGPDSFFDSIQVETDTSGLSVTIGSAHPGARAQEYGAEIYPVKGTFLHFFTDSGQEVFTKHVTLPARPYLGPAVDGTHDQIEAEIKRALGLLLP